MKNEEFIYGNPNYLHNTADPQVPQTAAEIDGMFDPGQEFTIKTIAKRTGLGLRKLYAFCRKMGLIEKNGWGIHEPTQYSNENGFSGETIPLTNKTSGYTAPTVTLSSKGVHYLFEKLFELESLQELDRILREEK